MRIIPRMIPEVIRHSIQRLFVACFICLLASCSDDPVNPELETAREKWEAWGYTDYNITEYRDCYCPLGGEPIRLLVRADSIVSGMNLYDSTAVGSDQLQWYKTVTEIFNEIEGLDAGEVSSLEVTYHPDFGYPERYFVDPSASIADEEHGYRLEDLLPLR